MYNIFKYLSGIRIAKGNNVAKAKNPYILTSFGADGAVSAAIILSAYPKAKITITSTNRLHNDLNTLTSLEDTTIYICGLGAANNFNQTIKPLAKIKKKNSIIWFCGRGYMDLFQDELQKYCKTVFNKTTSNAEAVAEYFRLQKEKKNSKNS